MAITVGGTKPFLKIQVVSLMELKNYKRFLLYSQTNAHGKKIVNLRETMLILGGLKNFNILSFLSVILTPIRRDVFDTFLSRFPKEQENRMTQEWNKTKCLLNRVSGRKKVTIKAKESFCAIP
ncbi:hypothetical protein CEXT_456191 [Caerostris extrusa]|uniref:Uncharacterized protein n=1 Tax=Caerostris extrusa TaxID=172846 RepID=A0AAV4RUD7_CAEEX|nr:hypothetical protein CEXT_456191 [Caerostris extrusa]